MKKLFVIITVLFIVAAVALVGCEKKQSSLPPVQQPAVAPMPAVAPTPATAPTPAPATMPAPAKPAKK